jgi:exopolysaccharide biosynthesis polyprenyl glycosylphosphotransferase
MNSSNAFALIQRVADALTVLLSFALGFAYYLAGGARTVPYDFGQFMLLGAVAAVVFLNVFQWMRLYEPQSSLLQVVETRRLLLSWVLGSLILFSIIFFFRFLDLSRLMVFTSLGGLLVLLLIERAILYQVHVSLRRAGAGRAVVIYGAGVVGRHLFKRIYHSPGLGLHVIGFLDDDTNLWGKTVHMGDIRRKVENEVLGGLDQLGKLIARRGLAEIFVAIPNATYQRNLEIVELCRREGLTVSVVPPTYGRQMHTIDVEDIGGIPILREKMRRPHFLYASVKRTFDIAVSLTAMLLLSPLYVVLALLVKFDSPGPMIFRQRRVGKNGVEFDFYKFRSMRVDANPYAHTPQHSTDPRITRFGRWLRRSSLDELPQLWNVLKGDMSLVGPRPEMPFIVATYNEEQRERLKVKPGITGVWQISAVRGEPIHANIEYDLFYIEHRSLLLDVIIMVKTLVTAIRGIGAV